MKKFLITACLASVLLLSGCATTIKLKPEIRKSIHTVSVNKYVKKPKQMYLSAPGVGIADLAFGSLATGLIEANIAVTYDKFLIKHQIYVKKIIRNQFIKAFKHNPPFRLVTKNGDADLRLTITTYGYTVPNEFSSYLEPVLAIKAQLIKNNIIVWQKYTYQMIFDNTSPRHTVKEIKQNPQLLAVMLKDAAKEVSKQLVADLRKQ